MRHNNIAGWRQVGDKKLYFRSLMEWRYACCLELMLEHKNIKSWEHEPKTFWFEEIRRGVRSYLPDFMITENDGSVWYAEVKGYMDPKSATKIKRMAKYHPKIDLRVITKV